MAQNNDDSGMTQKYGELQNSADQMTQQYNSGMAFPGRADAKDVHGLSEGDTLELNGKKYVIERLVSMTGAEAIVYLVKNEKGEDLVLKLYYPFQMPGDEPNAEALERIKKMEDPNILRLYDYGTGKKKYKDKFCFEIIEYARGGDLLNLTAKKFKKKYSEEFLTHTVIPEMLAGIRVLHKNRIYHGDLKPHNVFFLDEDQKDIVIGDYGSSKTFEQASGKSLAYTVMSKGTNFYISPEQARGVISEKNDFYSFGMVLLHLIYPDLVNQETLRKIVERQFSKKPIIDYNQKFGRLNDLIAGLTLQDLDARWGEAEVERWIQGETIPVRYSGEIIVESSAVIKLGEMTVHTADDLIHYLKSSPKWHEVLYEDVSGRQLLYNWIAETYDLQKKNDFKKMLEYYEVQKDADSVFLLRESIIRFLQPKRPILMNGVEFDFFEADDPSALLNEYLKNLDDLWKSSRTILTAKNYIFLMEFSLRKLEESLAGGAKARVNLLLDKISSVFNLKPRTDFYDHKAYFFTRVSDKSILDLFYAFNSNRVFRDEENQSIPDIKQIALYFAARKERYRAPKMIEERNYYVKKIGMRDLEDTIYTDFIFHVLKDHTKAAIEILSFEPQGKNHAVRFRVYKNLNDYFYENDIDPQMTGIAGGILAFKENLLRKISESAGNFLVSKAAERIADAGEKWEKRRKRKKEKKQQKKGQQVQDVPLNLPADLPMQLPDNDEETFLLQFWNSIENQTGLAIKQFSELNVKETNSILRSGLERYRQAVQHAMELDKIKTYKTRMMSYFVPPAALLPLFTSFILVTVLFAKFFAENGLNSGIPIPVLDGAIEKLKEMDNVYPWDRDIAFGSVVFLRGIRTLLIPIFIYSVYLISFFVSLQVFRYWEHDEEFKKKFVRKNMIPLNFTGLLAYCLFLFPVTVMGFANFPRLYLYFHCLSVLLFSGIYFYNSLMASQKGLRTFTIDYILRIQISEKFNLTYALPAVYAGIAFVFLYAVFVDLFI
ncbi:MAG: protein kinase [Spirochaetia bacterium]|nr:protein kinase [Spirochaetia bacterium]